MRFFSYFISVICFAIVLLLYVAGLVNCMEEKWAYAGLCSLTCAVFICICFDTWRRNRYRRMRLKKVDRLTGEDFEEYLRAHFTRLGYRVKLTPSTADYGADLLLKKRGKTTVVQAKRYEKPVGIAAVQEVIGAAAYYETDQAMVVTNRYFTRNARNLADQSQVELWDRSRLKKEFGAKE